MKLHVLDRKLLRDIRRLWSQVLAIARVLACGVAILLTAFGMVRALDATLKNYYDCQNFAELFGAVRRAPEALIDEIRAIDGVTAAELRATG
ncbi:hypothetical protein [uncultured Limimaricola sp.]|uniref:hypothetical protein n=1 Tax=uncultured Limimaricola sp. TaxID=2211667 RepID=UPI0030FA33F6